jgi:hypothetical protein
MDRHLHPDHVCEICRPRKPLNSPLWGPEIGRREFFKIAGAGVAGYSLSLPGSTVVHAESIAVGPVGPVDADLVGKARNVIFILLSGAPSHVDTFDLKVGAWTPRDFAPELHEEILFPKGLMPTLFPHLGRIALVRSLRAPALAHGLQQTWVQISRNPASALGKLAPNIGSVVALEGEKQRTANQKLPGFISLNTGGNLIGQGYFNPVYTPFDINAAPTGLSSLAHPQGQAVFEKRYQMLLDMDGRLRNQGNSPLGEDVNSMESFYRRSRDLMYNTEVDAVFKFSTEDQQRYGASGFGNSCLVARNLIKSDGGTRYIQINLGGWDNHANLYQSIRTPARQLDRGLGNLITDLSSTPSTHSGGSLLDETLIVAMGEFGRTTRGRDGRPGLNDQNGRDHHFVHFALFAGGGVTGGRAIGETTFDGFATLDPGWSQNRPVVMEDIAATIYSALGIDYTTTLHDDPLGRGFEYVPFASQGAWRPVLELFTKSASRRPPTDPRPAGRPR